MGTAQENQSQGKLKQSNNKGAGKEKEKKLDTC